MCAQVLEMNPDLAKERSACPFSKEEITNLFDGGPDKTAERRRVQNLYFDHPEVGRRILIDNYFELLELLKIFVANIST
jgi:hypothetical protein